MRKLFTQPVFFFFCQWKYALDIIVEIDLLLVKLAQFSLPWKQNCHLALVDGYFLNVLEQHRLLVRHIIYLRFTGLELLYCVDTLSQFMQQPRQEHYEVELQVVWYLKGSSKQEILWPRESELRLYGWDNSDWANCYITQRSLIGYFVLLE